MTNKGQFRAMLSKALVFMISATFVFAFFVPKTEAAAESVLSLSPNTGTFVVDSTFDVSIFLDTRNNSINTVDLAVKYPPDKLQLVSSGTGKSIIGLWTSQPKYNNQTGVLELTGGVPGGVNVQRGLITTLTFRVKAAGTAVVKFDRTRVLLNDGLGTEVLTHRQDSVYDLTLPPPAGPVVVSETHPDQTQWYRNNTVILKWGDEAGSESFSYMISDQAIDVPDEISEGNKKDVVYRNLGDGRRYFHIRALRAGVWGGTTHFALNIDTTPPAEFELDVSPSARTSRRQPFVEFGTTDSLSGTDHYELRLINLSEVKPQGQDEIFFEVQSPYVTPELQNGSYDMIVRAFDKAGNYREVIQRIEIVPVLFRYVSGRGFEIRSNLLIPWWILLILIVLITLALFVLGRRMHVWHRHVERRMNMGGVPEDMQHQMDELRKYRAKYGKLAVVMLALLASLFSGISGAQAQQQDETSSSVLASPLITTLSKDITNEEIFYIGGKSGGANVDVVLYIQNLTSAETISKTIKSDRNGDWFYRHDVFLMPGNYVLWAQSRAGNVSSPPSPQVTIDVEETAIQFGATRISYAVLYLILFLTSLVILLGLLAYIIYHSVHGRRKHRILMKEITEAQESLRRGFAVLNRDIQAELDVIRRAKLNQKLSAEEKQKEEQLLKDLQDIEQYMTKEVWEVEQAEQLQ